MSPHPTFPRPILLVVAALVCCSLVLPPPSSAAPPRATARVREAPRPALRPFDREAFLRLFKSNREELKSKALDTIVAAQTTHPDVPDALWEAISHDLETPRVNANTLRAVAIHGSLDAPQAAERQLALLQNADPLIVIAAIDSLAERRPDAALEPLIALAGQPAWKSSYALRQAAVNAVAEFPRPAAIGFLIATLTESRGQLKYAAASQLALRTGQNFGGNAEEWRTWWDASRDTFQFQPLAARRPIRMPPQIVPWDYDVPKFYGVPIYAERVVFVIDRSKSMLSSVDDVTRLEEAQRELDGAIRKLPDTAWFDVVAYESSWLAWKPALVQATPVNKSDAIRAVNRLEPAGKTACYDALHAGLFLDDQLELVLFLSDGEPTAGTIVDTPTIVQTITAANQFRRTVIDTIGIDARDAEERFLEELSAKNFGHFRSIR